MVVPFHPTEIPNINHPIRQYFIDLFPGIENPLDCPLCGHDVELIGEIDTPPISAQLYAQKKHFHWAWKANRYHCPHCGDTFDAVHEFVRY